eukprot:1142825-Pelagomonas_calceolata.AAC.5
MRLPFNIQALLPGTGDGWAGEPSMPNRSIHTSLTRSANSAPLAQLPMKSPGVRAAAPFFA